MGRLLNWLAKILRIAYNWAKNNWRTVQKWLDIGMYFEWILSKIKQILGIK
ncbi:aureocin A53 family class IId bacteriocin [Streptococcus parasuis]|uniref:aureocin A53 family class IId bacteriocin n=1 Tax=Streptococcus parasuis TaxID=1501662 RepID=UPI001C1F6B64|nr:aureocin A53 family class IId bacteriocin [Streptococcus parasuis]QWV86313.1 aureocin A53 family class IId bacteriocin [Streptococcus parasuis]